MSQGLSNKRIITIAPTGAWPTKQNNPAMPMTPREIADDVYACWKAGAAVAHIHVRDDEGRPVMTLDKFSETVRLIREHKDCDIVINLTTSGSPDATDEERLQHLKVLKPDMASLDCGSMNWQHKFVAVNTPEFLDKLGRTMLENNVKPEIEVFETGMLYEALYLEKQGAVKAPIHFQFALGVPGGMPATIENLVFLVNKVPEGCTWGAVGIGKASMPVFLGTLALGGHPRVGFEDNVMYKYGELAQSNVQLVERARRIIEYAGYEAATPEEARQILGITQGKAKTI